VLADAAALSQLANRAFAEELAFKVDDAIVRGDGTGKPLGILNAGCLISVSKESGQAAASFTYGNAVAMRGRLSPRSRSRAAWFMNQEVESVLPNMNFNIWNSPKTDVVGGSAVYIPAGNASEAPFGRLLGMNIVIIEQASALGTAGDVILADMSQYYLATKGGLQQAESMHVAFLTGEMCYRFTYRCDGQPARKAALTPYKGSATIGSFIVCDVRG
jgi:HK97 family phage major capsid protein